jgi:hypothetical protein
VCCALSQLPSCDPNAALTNKNYSGQAPKHRTFHSSSSIVLVKNVLISTALSFTICLRCSANNVWLRARASACSDEMFPDSLARFPPCQVLMVHNGWWKLSEKGPSPVLCNGSHAHHELCHHTDNVTQPERHAMLLNLTIVGLQPSKPCRRES